MYVDVDHDQSVIVELLAHQDDVADSNAGVFFFNNLAEDNDASEGARVDASAMLSAVDMAPYLAGCGPAGAHPVVAAVRGVQLVSKFNEGEEARNRVVIYLAVIRLPSKDTDVVLTLNVPTKLSTASSSATLFENTEPEDLPVAPGVFAHMLKTFRVCDWGLFDG